MQNTITQEKTGTQLAAEYAEGVAAGIETLDALAENIDAVTDYANALENCDTTDPDDAETLSDYAEALDAALGGPLAISEVLSLWHELGKPSDASEVVQVWVDGALDVEVTGRHTGNGWEVTDVALLVAFGGPTARVVWDGSSTLAVRCSWWSAEVVRRVECDALAIYAEGIAESVES